MTPTTPQTRTIPDEGWRRVSDRTRSWVIREYGPAAGCLYGLVEWNRTTGEIREWWGGSDRAVCRNAA